MQKMRVFLRAAVVALLSVSALVAACTGTRSAPGAGGPASVGSTGPSAPTGPAAEPVTSELAALTFDSAWSRIATTHYDTAFAGVDWSAVRAELRPRAVAAGTLGELRAVLSEMLERLGESHFGIIPGEVADAVVGSGTGGGGVNGDAGLAVRIVGDDVLITHVKPGGAAARAGIRQGWTLLAANGRDVRPWLEAVAALPPAERRTTTTSLLYRLNGMLTGAAGDSLRLTLADGSGREAEHTVTLQPSPGQVVRFGNLPPALVFLEHDRLPDRGDDGAGCVGLIRFNMWMVPLAAGFDRAVDALRGCRGMIIDLRGNPGGVAGMVMGTAGHFLNDTLPLGFMKQRTTELRFKANPRRVSPGGSSVVPFAGPLAVLTDEMTASTSEFFAGGLQGVGRARVFGTTTAGQALPAAMVRLPTGDVLMHVVADFTGPGGVRLEGRGVVPDVTITPARQALLHGRDPVLEAAMEWIHTFPVNGEIR